MRLVGAVSALLTLSTAAVNALYESQAGVIDWHIEHIGIPQLSKPTKPTFHRVAGAGGDGRGKAIVLTATEKNVLAALNPGEGNTGPSTSTPFSSPPYNFFVQFGGVNLRKPIQ